MWRTALAVVDASGGEISETAQTPYGRARVELLKAVVTETKKAVRHGLV